MLRAMPKLAEKIAIVTGAGQGVGRGIALALAAEGARIAVAGRTLSKCETVAGEIEAAGGEAIAEAAARAPTAGRASRTNTLFSIPMLFFMGAARHLTGLQSGDGSYLQYYAAMLAIILLVELNIFYGAAATQKPLGSVSGTIHAGLWATLVLFLCASYML